MALDFPTIYHAARIGAADSTWNSWANSDWSVYVDIDHDGVTGEQGLFSVRRNPAAMIAIRNNKIAISNLSVWTEGTTTWGAERIRFLMIYSSGTLTCYSMNAAGTITTEFSTARTFTSNQSGGVIIGALSATGAVPTAGTNIGGTLQSLCVWDAAIDAGHRFSLFAGVSPWRIDTANLRLAPDLTTLAEISGNDQILMNVHGQSEAVLSATFPNATGTPDNPRILRNPDTGSPAQYDSKYWMAYNTQTTPPVVELASSTDLTSWTYVRTITSDLATGTNPVPTDFIDMSGIAGAHDDFWLFYSGDNSTKGEISVTTSNDLTTWTDSTANPILTDAAQANGAEDFQLCRLSNGTWFGVYEYDGEQSGGIAVGTATNSATVPDSTWTLTGDIWDGPDTGLNSTNNFTANPTIIRRGSILYAFVEATYGFTHSSTLLKICDESKATDASAWTSLGVVYCPKNEAFEQGFPNSAIWDGTSIQVYCQSGTTSTDQVRRFAYTPDELFVGGYVGALPRGAYGLKAGAGGTTVNLTGASSTGAAGSFAVTGAASVTVTGASSTGAVGTMTATGAAVAAILGASSTGAVGSPTVTGAASTALTGASATGSAGTLTATGAANITITGVSSTGQVGSLSVTVGGAVTVGLTGVSATGRVGVPTVRGAASVNVTGASATGQPGTITATVGGTTVILTGAGATGRVGTLSITGAANIAMSGASATGAAGSLSVTIPGSEAHIVATITITPAIGGTLELQPAIDGTITIN